MKTIFIEQNKKTNLLKSVFYKLEKSENKIIINTKIKKMNLKSKIKLVNKICNFLSRKKVKQVVLDKELKEDKDFLNFLYSHNINICNKNWLFKHLADEIIQEVLTKKKREECEISICVNELDALIQEYIEKFAKEFKRVNIVTNHIGKFRKIDEKLYQNEGILLNITNNRRKSLEKSMLILNADFPKELFNKFNICDESVIIDWEGDLKIRKKRFNGRIINDYDISIDDDNDILKYIEQNQLQDFDKRDICQVIQMVPSGKIIL